MKRCSFCNEIIEESMSICIKCMQKYNISAVSLEDGCSCDTK